ncbi:uncharacterized protein BX663DRAFT_428993 [Cokeromyces recurvatus]|uniref:uncharacterized protein n=1 Tax=Cokeromyces recurvatus TaxID=90255 RepID=UPI00221F2D3F|nr:uncharacterized protein BX663DRAFT_428993 [Cokeromyces recurvatus]KAI7906261.1 hypothetical protein BX663DRAFT_428993 [Cokeromyces recurvatus]
MTAISPNNPPYPAYRATNTESFAYDTTIRRWPIIINGVIDDVKQTILTSSPERAQEGVQVINACEALKKEIAEDKPLRPIQDNASDTEKWNNDLKTYFNGLTWFTSTWLFNECYLYRRLTEIFNQTQYWQNYDPFERQKIETFRGSHEAVFDLARKMQNNLETIQTATEGTKDIALDLIYHELIQVCLWGNATDLSLLTNISKEDIKHLQAIEKEHLTERKKFILVDDTEKLWSQLQQLENGRVDFVLDNSGFEVFVDMVFADWLIQSKRAAQVVFHCKTIPWFVSDVMPKDIPLLFKCCFDRHFFPHSRSQDDVELLEKMIKRWQGYYESGQLKVRSDDFWCSGLSYWYMKSDAPLLFEDMKKADVVLYKGDLNYRKLVFDCDWPVTTSFKEAIGPAMANDFTHIIALRTNKADPVVGLSEETRKDIESRATRQEWRFSGKYAVVEYN